MNKNDEIFRKMFEPTTLVVSDIVDSIIKETGNFKHINGMCTLMSTIYQYDNEGRPLNADVNYKWETFNINSKYYTVIKKGWVTKIIEGNTNWGGFNTNNPLYVLDETPEYVLEHRKQKYDTQYKNR